ncbi:hypothetical protein D3C84_1203910 [compost metagenome]
MQFADNVEKIEGGAGAGVLNFLQGSAGNLDHCFESSVRGQLVIHICGIPQGWIAGAETVYAHPADAGLQRQGR